MSDALKLALRAIVTVAGLAMLALPVHAQTTLKMGFGLPLTGHYGVGAVFMQQELPKRTQGRYQLELFPAFALGGEREMVEGVQLGAIDLTITSTGPIGNFVPDTLITDIPFLFRDYAHARSVLDGPIGQAILAKCPAKGIICLAWSENGFRHMTNSRREIKSPSDAKGLKVRTMENPVHITAFRTIGVLPTPMAFPEVFMALQQGTIDGQENPIGVITSSRLDQVQKYLTLTGHLYSPAMVMMSPAAYNKMSEADRKIMTQLAREGAALSRAQVERSETEGVTALRAAGMQVLTLSSAEKEAFQQAMAPAYKEFAGKFGQANIDAIRNSK